MAQGTHCVIGAGFAGLGAARALLARGVEVHLYEARPDVGGNWLDGVYDSTCLITSRDSTGFVEYPMPGEYPDFPDRHQMLDYLRSYAEHFDLRRRTRFDHQVTWVSPAGSPDGTDGWLVTYRRPDGEHETRHYAGVVIANGHHWDKFQPTRPGTFTGQELHAKDYRDPKDLDGPRVLVVGAGNSACDLVVEASETFGVADVSMRRTYHFMPKTLFGKPITELNRWWMPNWIQRRMSSAVLRVVTGPYAKYGMPEPDHQLFSRPTTINSQMMYAMRHGKVRYRPDIARFDGRAVRFVDGRTHDYDTIVWATGYRVTFPFLDHGRLSWIDGVPVRVCGLAPPGLAGIYVFGLIQLRGGAGPLLSRSAELLADMVEAQSHTDGPIADRLARVRRPDTRFFTSVPQMIREVYAERKLLAGYSWLMRRRGRWTESGPLLSGDLIPARRDEPQPELVSVADGEARSLRYARS